MIAGFDWDKSNRGKCQKHGVSPEELEDLFTRQVAVRPDPKHSMTEERFCAVGRTKAGRHVFLIFTFRTREGGIYIRPISARYMHKKEIEHYEEENSDL